MRTLFSISCISIGVALTLFLVLLLTGAVRWGGDGGKSQVPEPPVTWTSPTDGQPISGTNGAVVSGRINSLSGEDLWVFDFAELVSGGSGYYRVNDTPLPVVDHTFSVLDQPIGDGANDVGSTFVIVLVLGTPSCSAELSSARPDASGSITFRALPQGCREVGRRSVVKTSP